MLLSEKLSSFFNVKCIKQHGNAFYLKINWMREKLWNNLLNVLMFEPLVDVCELK